MQIDAHFRKVLLILGRSRRAEADGITVVIQRRAGHDGVEIEHAQRLARPAVEQDVIELRIVVRDAQRQLAAVEQAAERARLLLAVEREADIIRHAPRPARSSCRALRKMR